MHLLSLYTIRPAQSLMEFLSRPKIELLMKKVLTVVFIVNVLLVSALYVKIFVFAKDKDVLKSADHNQLAKPIFLGTATEVFIQQLKNNNFNPVLISKVKRRSFSVAGSVIAVNGDNFQVFEYVDHDSAMKDASPLAQKFASSSRSTTWKKNMHVYTKDTLVIFYMGKESGILASLNENGGLALK